MSDEVFPEDWWDQRVLLVAEAVMCWQSAVVGQELRAKLDIAGHEWDRFVIEAIQRLEAEAAEYRATHGPPLGSCD